MTRRDFLATTVLATGGALAAACGIGGGGGQSASTPSGGKAHITFLGLFWLDDELKAVPQMVEEFNRQSRTVEVEYVQSSWAAIENKMTVAFSSGDVPDVFQYYDAGLVPWGQNGLLADLRPLLAQEVWTDFNKGTLSALTSPKGDVIGMPFETETPLIYYNTAMLERAQVQPATMDHRWTWDQLHAAAVKLSHPESQVFGLATYWASSQILFKNGLGWQAGATPIRHDKGTYRIDVSDSGDRSAMTFLASLFNDKAADVSALSADAISAFLSGRAAMLVLGAWGRAHLPTVQVKNPVDWKVMPFTTGSVTNLGTGAAQTLSIPSASKNKKAAAEFIAWWSRPENVARICKAGNQIPPNTKAVDMLKQQVGTSQGWDLALAEAPALKNQPYCPGWLAMLTKSWDPPMYDLFRRKLSYDAFAEKVGKDGTDFVQTAAGTK